VSGSARRARRGRRAALAALALLVSASCAGPPPSPERYRLTGSGTHWDRVGSDRVFEDVAPRYPEFFAVVLDPGNTNEPDLIPLRDDLESRPVDRRNYDALNAVAIAYFELNYRAQAERGGSRYLVHSFRATKLLAVPWRAYGLIDEPRLRDAILDFFEDAATSEKLRAHETAGRLARVVESLERKERDPRRLARIRALVARIRAEAPQAE